MSLYGFDERYNKLAPKLTESTDEMTESLKYPDVGDEDETYLEDVYDGLGDQLEETGDDFNDDTFGDEQNNLGSSKLSRTDYDFFGRTAKISKAIIQDQIRFNQERSAEMIDSGSNLDKIQSLSRPNRFSYEHSSEPDQVPEMLIDASIWGVAPKRAASTSASLAPLTPTFAFDGRKILSVEELEASMLNKHKNSSQQQPLSQKLNRGSSQRSQSVVLEQNPQHHSSKSQEIFSEQYRRIPHQGQTSTNLSSESFNNSQQIHQAIGHVPARNIPSKFLVLQNPNRYTHQRKKSLPIQNYGLYNNLTSLRHLSHPKQFLGLSSKEVAELQLDEVRREKRNRKIFLLSKGNGLMTPQDKNFINRIQLQQLVTAIGQSNDHDDDLSFTEDFYYQVYHQIHGGSREIVGNAYLFSSGEKYGNMRKQISPISSHLKQMEQQVQRAVEVAKSKPKNKQLVMEGALGKMSYSSAKTPKPVLNINLSECGTDSKKTGISRDRKLVRSSGSDRKTVLTDIERVYTTLMKLEDLERKMPGLGSNSDTSRNHAEFQNEWQGKAQKISSQLWRQLKVHEPIGATATHPFIALLSYGKGMKTVPRVFRHISQEQRTTILTMIILHLDQLDLVRQGVLLPGETQLSVEIREKIELFSLSVMPPLFGHLNDTGLEIVTGTLGLLLKINIDLIARTRIGVSILTMILSRAELLKQAGITKDKQEWDQWIFAYNDFFDVIEPTLLDLFPVSIDSSEDFYVWQFLAAIGIGANPKQQQRLVVAVKDRVMETVSFAKSLPPTISNQRLGSVNLFMRSIGLDVELLT